MKFSRSSLLVGLLAIFAASSVFGEIEKIDPPLRGFFGKRTVSHGVRILAHASVSDEALV